MKNEMDGHVVPPVIRCSTWAGSLFRDRGLKLALGCVATLRSGEHGALSAPRRHLRNAS